MKSKNLTPVFVAFLLALLENNILFAQITTLPSSKIYIYSDKSPENKSFWIPSGWMQPDAIGIVDSCLTNPIHRTCIKLVYESQSSKWAGIYWLPDSSWNSKGVNVYEKLNLHNRDTNIVLKFSARGDLGGEKSNFKVGGVNSSFESMEIAAQTGWITLGTSWHQYTINLTGKDLSSLVGGFCWVIDSGHNPDNSLIRIYVDEIYFEVQ